MHADLRSLRFRAEREESWRELERLLSVVEKRAVSRLTDDELVTLPALYRSALSSLSMARATSLDRALIEYLEALCARAYFFVYGPRTRIGDQVFDFLFYGLPAQVRSLWRETLLCLGLTLVAALLAFALILRDPEWFYGIIPPDLAQGRDPHQSAAALRATLYAHVNAREALGALATFLFTHNAQVALLAFALGFAFCMPTAMFIAYNGLMLGAFFAIFASRGLGMQFGGWVFIHGVTELFAIMLAGAAGLRIGWSIAFPGALTRLDAVARAGRQGGVVMAGVVLMLFIAGLLEGFARQLITADWARWTVAGATLALWIAYFYTPRGGRA